MALMTPICEELYDRYIKEADAVISASSGHEKSVSDIITSLGNLAASSGAGALDTVNSTLAGVDTSLPSTPSSDEVSMLKCMNPDKAGYIQSLYDVGADMASYPAEAVSDLAYSLVSGAYKEIDDALGNLSEAAALAKISQYIRNLKKAGLAQKLTTLDQIRACLIAHCSGTRIDNLPDYADQVRTDLGLDVDYEFDYTNLSVSWDPTEGVNIQANLDSLLPNVSTATEAAVTQAKAIKSTALSNLPSKPF